ncbi:MAG: PKD domain-containing protein, partial [Prolixibacteraceae bacterium]|nr:PKD domain-containing protein [Prolixibacteraceae bacterium]
MAFYRGLTQLTFVSGESDITIHKNTTVPSPETVTIPEILNQDWDGLELLEGKLIKIDHVTVVESGTFSGNASYQITDGTNTLTLRVDGDTDIPGTEIPNSEFSIVGCLSQYDSSEPYSTGYQLMPRNDEDIIITSVVSDFIADNTFGNRPLTVNFTDLSLNNPTSWLWDFGDGTTSTIQNPQHIYTTVGDYTVSLTVGDGANSNTIIETDYISVVEGILTRSSDNFNFYYTKSELCTDDLINAMEKKFHNLDYIIWADWQNIYLLDRSEKINVFLYENDQPFASDPGDVPDWDIGYYLREKNELHIRVPSTERQLKYFPTFEKAAISVLARYVMEKKRTNGNESSKGLSFGFGLYESGYSPDLDLIQNYLNQNNNTFPDKSTFSTWDQLDDELNVELAYTHVFAAIFRRGYFSPTVYDGLYPDEKDIWYQIIRLFFLTNIEDGGMVKYYDGDDFILYSNDEEMANLILEGLQSFANQFEEAYSTRINHPVLVTIYGSDEAYTYTKNGNIDQVGDGGEACSHSLLRAVPRMKNIDTEINRTLVKYDKIIGHEFMHNVFAFQAETAPPSWLNEGSAVYAFPDAVQGNSGININNFIYYHDFFWNNNSMNLPDLENIFVLDGGFGYAMAFSSFVFIKDNFSKETLLQFMKTSNDFSIIGYSGIDEFQKHLYESLYLQYMPSFLFNPLWNLETDFMPGSNFTFNWDGHYIENLIIEYSVDKTKTWTSIADVAFSTGSYSLNIP